MILYAIRHKPTGNFLSQLPKQRAGYTYEEPKPDCIPRLFKKPWHAKVALNCWVQGWHKVHWVQLNWETPDIEPDIQVTPIQTRKREDMEIVILTLLESGTYT